MKVNREFRVLIRGHVASSKGDDDFLSERSLFSFQFYYDEVHKTRGWISEKYLLKTIFSILNIV
jgi:hypothetical protein